MMNRLTMRWLGIFLVALPVVRPGAGEAQLPPNVRWQTVEAAHVRVTFAPGLESLARRAAASAEQSWPLLERMVSRPPRGKVDVVLADYADYSTGMAGPFPTNHVVIFAPPQVDQQALGYNGDWIDFAVSHELAHIFHMDRAGGFGMALRKVFGRLPVPGWPLFPVLGAPVWSLEGLGVNVESAFTGFGRIHGTYHDMVLRTATLENRFDRMDRLHHGASPIWPGAQRVYVYGSLFMHWLEQRYGEQVPRTLVDKTASAALPTFLFFDPVAKRAVGRSFGDLYTEWRRELGDRYGRLADSLRAQGLTATERVVPQGRLSLFPRVSPDGSRIAYAAEDGRDDPATRVFDLSAGRVVASSRSNGLGAPAWLLDSTALIRSQLEYGGPYRIYRDLHVMGERASRVTHRARLQEPDVARDGERVVAVENGGGTNRLVVLRLSSGRVEPITEFDPQVHWAFPRWSPDGSRIAVSRYQRGGEYDVVVLDPAGHELGHLTQDVAIDAAPAWSPDGRYIVFASDRSGIANLYAADVSDPAAPRLRQVTNLLTGAFYPDVSPDGRSIYFSAYHADGFSIERIPFDPATWREPSPVRIAALAPRVAGAGPAQVSEARSYSPIRSLLPKFWLPVIARRKNAGTFVGMGTTGRDLVGRHEYYGSAALDFQGSGRWQGELRYRWAGLGNPVLDLEASREWEEIGVIVFPQGTPPDTVRPLIHRNDVAGGFVTLLHQRWRSSASLSLGLERETFARSIVNAPGMVQLDSRDVLHNVVGRLHFSNVRAPVYAISPEDGMLLALEGRSTVESRPTAGFPRDYRELKAFGAAYKSLPLGSFAHHVLVLRGSALLRHGDGAVPAGIGGVAEDSPFDPDVGFSRLLPVRGFDQSALIGTRAWTATVEVRAPLALVGRRPAISPFFIDRIAGAIFADFGDAECAGPADAIYQDCRRRGTTPTPLTGAGAELSLDLGVGSGFRPRVRLGAAAPVRGEKAVKFYTYLGSSF